MEYATKRGIILYDKITKFVEKLKQKTAKECCIVDIVDGTPDIMDNKIGGIPYLPVGEKYPKSKDGKDLALLLQINCKDIGLPDYPTEGILEIFTDQSFTWPTNYEIRFFEEGRPYRKDLKMFSFEDFFVKKPLKIATKKGMCNMSISDYRFNDIALPILYETTGEKLESFFDIEKVFGYDIYEVLTQKLDEPRISIGGYPDFTQEDPRYMKKHSNKTECLFKLDSCYDEKLIDLGDAGILFALISKEDLLKKDFSKALVDWDCF